MLSGMSIPCKKGNKGAFFFSIITKGSLMITIQKHWRKVLRDIGFCTCWHGIDVVVS